MHYRGTIRRLHTAITTRPLPLSITHTLSHLEHDTTLDTDTHKRRLALAAADHAASLAHTQPAPRLPHPDDVDTFPLLVAGLPVSKNISAALHKQAYTARLQELCKYKMEGRLQRIARYVDWKTGASHWPDYLVRFRTKLWTLRLPTHTELHKRDSTHPDTCPSCPLEQDTLSHIFFHCPAHQHNTLALQQKINTLIRSFRHTFSLHPPISPAHTQGTINDEGLEDVLTTSEGWTIHTTDKHGRKTHLAAGPSTVSSPVNTSKSIHADWFSQSLHNPPSHLPPSSLASALLNARKAITLDPVLLNSWAKTLGITQIFQGIGSSPYLTCASTNLRDTLPSLHAQCKASPSPQLIDTQTLLRQHFHTVAGLHKYTNTTTYIIITDKHLKDNLSLFCRWHTLLHVPPCSISTIPANYWSGKHKPSTLMHNKDTLHLLCSSHTTPPHIKASLTSQFMLRSPSSLPDSVSQLSPPADSSFPETPPALTSLITSTSFQALALRGGGIPTSLMHSLTQETAIPIYKRQQFYRKLHHLLLEHSHTTWLEHTALSHTSPSPSKHSPSPRVTAPPSPPPPDNPPPPFSHQSPASSLWYEQRTATLTRKYAWTSWSADSPTPPHKRHKQSQINTPAHTPPTITNPRSLKRLKRTVQYPAVV